MDHLKFSGADVDVVFCFDTTGRMYRAVQEVNTQIENIVNRLFKDISIRIGVITHGDYGDDQRGNGCLQQVGLSGDGSRVRGFLASAAKTHGDDPAECYEFALRSAASFAWSKSPATKKILVLLGDDVPHPPSYTNLLINWREEALKLKGLGVKVYAVQALSSRHAKPFYSELANSTNGVYLNIKDFSLLPSLMLAICYKEASEAMLNAFVAEQETSKQKDALLPVLAPLLSSNKDTDYGHYTNLLPLVANTAWWNPRLHDNTKEKPAFIQDPRSRKFINQNKKDRDISELSTAYANSHLVNEELPPSNDFSVDMDQMALDISIPSYESEQPDNQQKKIRIDSFSPISSGPSTPVPMEAVTPVTTTTSSRITRSSTSSNSGFTRKGSRRLINDNDDDDEDTDTFNGFHFDGFELDNGSPSPSITITAPSSINNNNNVSEADTGDSPSKRYQTRLIKGRPRRASSFAFGDVTPSTPFSSMFASPSILTQANKRASRSSPFDSPIEESGVHSDSETTKKRKATWDPPTLRPRPARIVVKAEGGDKIETPRVGTMVAVRAQGGSFWLAKVTGFNGSDEVDVQWMDEIKSHHNFFVLLDWYDTISIRAIFKSRVRIDNMKKIGVYKLSDSEKQQLESIR